MIFHPGEHGFRISRGNCGCTGGIVEEEGEGRGGKSMENYLPNFSRASNTRMATFHLSFPLNVRSNVGNSTVVE